VPATPGRSRLAILTGLDVRAYRGGEKYAASLGRELVSRGVAVRLLSKLDPHEHYRLDRASLPAILRLPVEFYRLFWPPFLPPLPLEPRRFIGSFVWSETVYTMETTPRFAALVVVLARALGRRVVIGLHHPTLVDDLAAEVESEGRRRRGTFLARAVLRWANAVHVLNAHQAATLARIGVAANVTVVPNFVDVPPVQLGSPSSETFEALFVGPLEREQKGIDLLAEVARRVLAQAPDARLTVVGAGRDVELVRDLERAFPGQVRYLGFVPEEQLTSLYAHAHVLWMTSRAEAFPAVALEAFSHGTPVVGFAVAGIEDLSVVYPEGRVAPFDVEAFTATVLRLQRLCRERPADYAALRERCRAETSDRFGRDRVVPRLAELLGVRLAGPASRP